MENLYKMKSDILSKEFEIWAESKNGHKEHCDESPEIKGKIERLTKYIKQNGENLMKKAFDEPGVYEAVCLKGERGKVPSFHQMIQELEIDSTTYSIEDDSFTIVLSTNGRYSFLFGHYLLVKFDKALNIVYWEVC